MLHTKDHPLTHLVDPHGVEPELVEHGVGLVPGGEGGEEVPLALRLDLETDNLYIFQRIVCDSYFDEFSWQMALTSMALGITSAVFSFVTAITSFSRRISCMQ